MDFGREAIEKIEQLVEDRQTVEINGRVYTPAELEPVIFEPKAAALHVATLTGFTDFIDKNIDGLDLTEKYLASVVGPQRVELVSVLSKERREREMIITATLDQNMDTFPFGEFLPQEEFTIKLHSLFKQKEGDDFDYVSSYIAKVLQADTANIDDDGITQRVTVKRGVSGALVDTGVVKPIVKLSPYRTFREIEQPESQFLLRIKGADKGVYIALFEADGGQWRNEARLRIAEYLKSKLKLPVIA